jgi:CHAD domain-containing protein
MPIDQKQVQASIRKLRKSLKKGSKRLGPEDVHKLRTRIRRFESLDSALSLSLNRKSKRLSRPLKQIRKKAGRVRDMDVLTSHLATIRSDKEQSCLIQLFEYLGAKRFRLAARLRRLVRKHRRSLREALNKELKRASKNVPRRKAANSSKADRKAEARATAQLLRVAADLAEPAHLDRSNLHPYRLKVKHLHNLVKLEAHGEPRGEQRSAQKFADALAECKDAIGEWHDWEELIAVAAKVLDHGRRCALLRELKQISKQRLNGALAITHKLRSTYTEIKTTRKKSQGAHPISLPALRVVSGLVA